MLCGRHEDLALLLSLLLLLHYGAARARDKPSPADHQRQKRALSNERKVKNEVYVARKEGRKPRHNLISKMKNMESLLKKLSHQLQDISKTLHTQPPAPILTQLIIQTSSKETDSEVPAVQTHSIPTPDNVTSENEFSLFNSSADVLFIQKLEKKFPYIHLDSQQNSNEVPGSTFQTSTLPAYGNITQEDEFSLFNSSLDASLIQNLEKMFPYVNMDAKPNNNEVGSSGSPTVPVHILKNLKHTMDNASMSKMDSLLRDLEVHFGAESDQGRGYQFETAAKRNQKSGQITHFGNRTRGYQLETAVKMNQKSSQITHFGNRTQGYQLETAAKMNQKSSQIAHFGNRTWGYQLLTAAKMNQKSSQIAHFGNRTRGYQLETAAKMNQKSSQITHSGNQTTVKQHNLKASGEA